MFGRKDVNRKEKKEKLRRQSTRQLMGIDRLTEHGVKTPHGELVYFLIRPDNLSVLPKEGIQGRVQSLTDLISSNPSIQMLALDSRESFQQNKLYYQERREQEPVSKIQELLVNDARHLDEIQTTTASAREFVLAFKIDRQTDEGYEAQVTRMEKDIRECGFHVRAVKEQDVRRLLAVYYQQDVTTDYFDGYDGESVVKKHGI